MKGIFKFVMIFWGAILFLLSGTFALGEQLKLTPVDKVVILELYGDNTYPLGKSDNIVTRLGDTRSTGRISPPLAAHGMGVWVEISVDGKKRTLLFDAGDRADVMVENFRYFGKNPEEIEAIAVSHGHSDHFGGLAEVLKAIKPKNKKIPIYTGSNDAFATRYIKTESGELKGPWTWSKEDTEHSGGQLFVGGPRLLLDGLALYTGSIPYITSYENINPGGGKGWCVKQENGEIKMIDMPEEGALVINLKNRGLVVLSGCTHRGTVNTLKQAQNLTGIKAVYARYGSFQKADKDKLIEDLLLIKPTIFIGTHCAMDKPELIGAFKTVFPQNGMTYYQSVIGSQFTFSSE
ncbi:MAG: MBL fold metallo-hydrolase [Candidatus Schekmanbacteria bacterium]|nr:MBL fold metallo-hydrolase [Candidatus Schekmanbacteria bacterium]